MKEIEIKVSGMMCSGCENRVKNALKQIDGVEDVIASYVDGIVKVSFKDELDENKIKSTIEDIGYNLN